MKIRALLVAMSVATVLTGCQNMDSNGLLSSGAEAFQAYSLSDAQVKTLSDQACQEMDSKATIAPANSEYAKTSDNYCQCARQQYQRPAGELQSVYGEGCERLCNG